MSLPSPSLSPDGSLPSASARSERIDRALRVALEVAGCGVWLFALRGLWQRMDVGVGVYDEGILLTNAQLLLAGKVPYRDFYSNYPPGVFLMLAGLFKVFGPSVAVARWLGLVMHVASGLWAGRLAGQIAGQRFSAVAAGLVTLWMMVIDTGPFAYVLAVHGALLALMLVMRAWERGTRGAYLLAGVALGAVSWMRHDLCALMLLVMGAGALVVALWQRAWKAEVRPRWAWLPWIAAGVALAAVPFWLPWFVLAGPRLVLGDLVFDQARYVMPARQLPMPPLLAMRENSGLPFPLPVFIAQIFEGAVVLTLIGPVLATLGVLLPGRASARGRLGAAMVGAFSLAVIPQMAGRTDFVHAVYTVAPALVMVGVFSKRLGALPVWRWALALLILVVASWPLRDELRSPPIPPRPPGPGFERASGREVSQAIIRREVLEFIAQHTHSPRDPVFIGLMDHSLLVFNEMDLYFFANRVGATRYMQFDPNIVTRLDVQQRMAEEILASGTRVVVLSGIASWFYEPNASSRQGSHYLDGFLREHFTVVRIIPPYWLMLRRE